MTISIVLIIPPVPECRDRRGRAVNIATPSAHPHCCPCRRWPAQSNQSSEDREADQIRSPTARSIASSRLYAVGPLSLSEHADASA
jgi:hypothetical protein